MTSVFVENPMEAFKFYTEVLGFKEHTYMPEAWVAIVVSPEQPEGTALLLEPNQHPLVGPYQKGLYEAGFPCITLGTDDIQADYERLKAKGVIFRGEPEVEIAQGTEWGTHVIFEDTFGNLIQLHQNE